MREDADIAFALNVLLKEQAIPFVRIGKRTMRFNLADIEHYLKANLINKGQGE